MDLFDKCRQFAHDHQLRRAEADGVYPYFIPFEDSDGTEVIFQGRSVLMMGSNNYMGLTTDLRVQEAAAKAVKRYGTSCTGSRFLNG